MPAARRHFRPGLAATVAVLIAVPLFVSLGFWQLSRAEQKDTLQREHQLRSTEAPLDLPSAQALKLPAAWMEFRRVRLYGAYDAPPQFLLDNQVYRGQAGYFVYTPFLLDNGPWRVLVNRGWMAAGPDRMRILPVEPPDGATPVAGNVRLPPFPGLRSGANPPEAVGAGLLRLQEIDFERIAADQGWALLPYEVRLDAPTSAGLVRDWPPPGSGRERHLGYAFQWFLFAAAAVILYVVLNLKKTQVNE
jgi:surfeit locus 1 family protein